MRPDIVQENRCAVCGQRLGLAADPDLRDDMLSADDGSAGMLPICSACQDELYYGDDVES